MANASSEKQYVTFSLEAEVYAVPVAVVREILDFRDPFKIPKGPDYLLGLTDVRGEGVPTIDLRTRLGLPRVAPTHNTRILVIDLDVGGRTLALGLVADRVFEVAAFDDAAIEPAPDIGARWDSDFIHGVVKRPEGFVLLLDIVSLFSGGATEEIAASKAAA